VSTSLHTPLLKTRRPRRTEDLVVLSPSRCLLEDVAARWRTKFLGGPPCGASTHSGSRFGRFRRFRRHAPLDLRVPAAWNLAAIYLRHAEDDSQITRELPILEETVVETIYQLDAVWRKTGARFERSEAAE
jgi:hypothetical protein